MKPLPHANFPVAEAPKEFWRNIGVYGFFSIFPKLISVVSVWCVSWLLPPVSFGKLEMLRSGSVIGALLLIFGLDHAHVALFFEGEDSRRVSGRFLVVRHVLTVIAFAIFLLANFFLHFSWAIWATIGLATCFAASTQFFLEILRLRMRPYLFLLVGLVSAVFSLTGMIVGVTQFSSPALGYAAGSAFGEGLGALVGLMLAMPWLTLAWPSLDFLRKAMPQGVGLLAVQMIPGVVVLGFHFIFLYWGERSQWGIFSLVAALATMGASGLEIFRRAIWPGLVRKSEDVSGYRRVLVKIYLVVAISSSISIVLAPIAMRFFFSKTYFGAATIAGPFFVGVLFWYTAYLYFLDEWRIGNNFRLGFVYMFATLLGLGTARYLIPVWGAKGAVVAFCLMVGCIHLVLGVFLCRRSPRFQLKF